MSKKCCNFDIQREMFKYLGRILYCTRNGPSAMDAIEEFLQIFVDQCAFMDYFNHRWLPRIEMWVATVRSLPMANQEFHAAIESYHLRLKSKLFGDSHSSSWLRVDWLAHIMTTELHSLFWFDQYTEESGFFRNLREVSFFNNSWCRAVHIPDVDVMLDEQDLRFAKVVSQSNRTMYYTIWNPGSEFSLCDCTWSRLGNFCKHVIKVGIICRIRHVARPSLAAQTYRQTLLSLLQNPPDDPIVLDHAIIHATRIQQEIKGLEELSNNGLLSPLPPFETVALAVDNILHQSMDGPAKMKRPRTSVSGMNAIDLPIEFAGQVSPVINSQTLTNCQMREVLHSFKVSHGSNQGNIIDEQSVISNCGIRSDID